MNGKSNVITKKPSWMTLNIDYYLRCIKTLQNAYILLQKEDSDSIQYEIYRSACIKEFEIILEQSGKLLRKILKPYFHSSREVDGLFFKDLFRQAVLRSLMSDEACQRWFEYRAIEIILLMTTELILPKKRWF